MGFAVKRITNCESMRLSLLACNVSEFEEFEMLSMEITRLLNTEMDFKDVLRGLERLNNWFSSFSLNLEITKFIK